MCKKSALLIDLDCGLCREAKRKEQLVENEKWSLCLDLTFSFCHRRLNFGLCHSKQTVKICFKHVRSILHFVCAHHKNGRLGNELVLLSSTWIETPQKHCLLSSAVMSAQMQCFTHVVGIKDFEDKVGELGRVPVRKELLVDVPELLQIKTRKHL